MITPRYTVLVPVYNEAASLQSIMPGIAAACPDAQIIYIDDGSSDGSAALLEEQARPKKTEARAPL